MDIENNDVNSESSAEIEQTEQQPAESSTSEEIAPVEAKSQEDNVPFHLHPRFQEVIQQKNQLAEQNKAFERQLADMAKRIESYKPVEAPKADALMERLRGIDPEFAERFGKVQDVDTLKQELNEFKQWRQELAAEQTRTQVSSQKESFYNTNNVPTERRSIYEAMLVKEANANRDLKISDLPAVMKKVHEDLGKLFKDVERTTTANYVQGKKADASKPALQPKGKSVASVNETKYSKNPLEARAQLTAEIMKEVRAAKDI